MPPRFDAHTRSLRISVSDLLWKERRSESRSWTVADRSLLGQRAHQQYTEYQATKKPSYEVEVPLEVKLEIGEHTVFLRGRIDGRWKMKQFTVVEEIKSVTSGLEGEPLDSHRLQGEIYSWMQQRLTGDLVKVCLTRVDLWTGESVRSVIDPEMIHLETVIMERLHIILRWFEKEEKRLEERAKAARRIYWPYPEYRINQREMEDAVAKALDNKRNLLLEAPTGSGKTAPILITALKHAASTRQRVAYATSRTAQQNDRIKLVRAAIPVEARGRILNLTAGERLCVDEYCACREAGRVETLFDPWEPPEWAEKAWERFEGILSRKELVKLADEQDVCPRRLQKDLTRMADVLIGDQNYFIQPFMQPSGWFTAEDHRHPRTILLMDEAHGIVDRLRASQLVHLNLIQLEEKGQELEMLGGLIERQAGALIRQFLVRARDVFDEIFDEDQTVLYTRLDSELDHLITPLQECALVLSTGRSEQGDETDDVLRAIHAAAFATGRLASFATYASRDIPAPMLNMVLVTPASYLQPRWQCCSSVIAFSATLSPFQVILKELGLDGEHTDTLQAPDTILRDHRLVIRYSGVSTRARDRENTLVDLADLLADAEMTTGGAWLVFVSSKQYQEWLTLALKSRTDINTLAIRGGDQKVMRFLIHNASRDSKPQVHVLEIHGPLREGVDLAVGAYNGLAVIGPALPPITPENEILRTVLDERGEAGYLETYAIPAMRTVVQASGRLLRNPDQRGILLFVGDRFATPQYETIAPEWLADSDVTDDREVLLDSMLHWWHG